MLTTDKVSGCGRITVPAVFYNPRDGYVGPDHDSHEVTDSNGEVGVYEVTINVKLAPAPSAPDNPKTGTQS